MHGAQHAGNKLVYAIALLHQGHQRSNSTLVVGAAPEVRENELLERIDLILKGHQVGDCFISLVWIVD
jgi:hypothetical protein